MSRRTASEERGQAVVIAIMLLVVLLVLGMAGLTLVDGAQRDTGRERVKETAFNLAEAALDQEVLLLQQSWPSTSTAAGPASCVRNSGSGCPSTTSLLQAYAGTDVGADAVWTVTVRDDPGTASTYYSRTVTDGTACGAQSPCRWDANGNGAVWVRSSATVHGQTRTVVQLVRRAVTRITMPRNTVTAGWFRSNNNGLKTIVDEKGCQAKIKPSATCNATDPAPVAVRCSSATAATPTDTCAGYRSGQVSPDVVQQGYPTNVLNASLINQMQTYAVQLGTYYSTACPTAAQLTGAMVFIDGLSCAYTSSTAVNSAASPGVLVVNNGSIALGGTVNFYGLLYVNSAPGVTGAVVTLSGNTQVQGSIAVDGGGGVIAGASGVNISFDPNVLGNIRVAGTPQVVQNSFRDLPAGQ